MRSIRVTSFIALSFPLLLVACPDEGTTGGNDGLITTAEVLADASGDGATDTPQETNGEVTGPEVGAETDTTDAGDGEVILGTGEFGDACTGAGDCASGLCVASQDGEVCSRPCGSGCPSGWSCGEANICYPDFAALCMPCKADADCAGFGANTTVCVPYGDEGGFCGGDCTFTTCPEGFSCEGVPDGNGGVSAQCKADSGTCSCSPVAIDLSLETDCAVTNEFGTCAGTRMCEEAGLSACTGETPAAEICDGLDNDCNGEVDDLVLAACEKTNGFGTCAGTETCDGVALNCDAQEPAEEVCDGIDNNCDGTVDEGSSDTDLDNVADCVDEDDDDDTVADENDNCPYDANTDQTDTDGDLAGDACDDDDDGDGVLDVDDNCQFISNPLQEDADGDLVGDACDSDLDSDGVEDVDDNCPAVPNPDQSDIDGDLAGDACDPDDDGDNVPDETDNCPTIPNENQADIDGDNIGDPCDDDDDNDTILNVNDNCPLVPNVDQTNTDGDLAGNACDSDDDNDLDPDVTDCAPLDPTISNNATESCLTVGIDDNCDTFIDEENADGCSEFFFDDDVDGFGIGSSKCLCAPAGKYTATVNGDCADDNFAIKPSADEICNSVDDNCSNTADDGPINDMCGNPANGTPSCSGQCVLTCDSDFTDLNDNYADGCECGLDVNDIAGDGNTCGTGVNLGTVNDNGGVTTVSGTLHTAGDSDWYIFEGRDLSPSSGGDDYNVRVRFSSNPGNEFRFDIKRGGCSTSNACSNDTDYNYFTNQNPGSKPNPGEGNCVASPGDTNRNVCNNDTSMYRVRVFRSATAGLTCSSYTLEVSNGL